jgi:hypothetical protein
MIIVSDQFIFMTPAVKALAMRKAFPSVFPTLQPTHELKCKLLR